MCGSTPLTPLRLPLALCPGQHRRSQGVGEGGRGGPVPDLQGGISRREPSYPELQPCVPQGVSVSRSSCALVLIVPGGLNC